MTATQELSPHSQDSVLYALGLTDGTLRWKRAFENALVSGLAVLDEGLILVATTSTDLIRGQGALVALGTAGEIHWQWSPGIQRVSAPAVTGHAVCVSVDGRTLIVLDRTTGAEQTRTKLDTSTSLSAPALMNSVAYVPCRGPYLLAVGLDGEVRWHFKAGDGSEAWLDKTPVVIGEWLFAVLSTGAVLALQVADGSPAWRASVGPPGKPLSPPATDGQHVFVGARDGLHALAPGDGGELWHFSTPRRITATPVATGGLVYITCHDHHLYALDAATGLELWRYEVGRRLELSPALPACGETDTPCVFIADRGGTVASIARALSAAEHKAAGHPATAASMYANLGQFAQGAELLEACGESLKAAELWIEAGELERAAQQYEAAAAWQQAAGLWSALGRHLRQARALEAHARSMEAIRCSDEERAVAWAEAARAFEAEGEIDRAADCRRSVARWLRQPIIAVDVQADTGLMLDAWSRLRFTIRNEGYGPARNLVIRAGGDQFEGQVAATRQIATLRAGHERVDWLDVRPRAWGDSVPLRVRLEYENQAEESCICEQTIYIPVARIGGDREAGQTFQISTAGGAIIVGDVTVRDGDLVGRDVLASADSGAVQASNLPATTHVLSFDRLSPTDFERLCLWLAEREGYVRAEHLGLAGSEQGRDVAAFKPTPRGEQLWYFQCKRYSSISAGRLKKEVDKYLKLAEEKPWLRPAGVIFVISCAVSARAREEVSTYCGQHGLACEFWALTELDMRVKQHPDLLKEFFNLPS